MRRIVLLLVLALVATACKVRLDVTVDIAADESGTVEFAVSLDQELRDLLSQSGNDLDAQVTEGIPDGWTVEEFVDGEFEGTRATTSFASIDDLRASLDGIASEAVDAGAAPPDFLSQLQLTRNGDVFDFSADLTGLEDGLGTALGGVGDASGGIDPSAFLSELVDIRLIITMPGEVLEHNADAIAGSTLSWNLSVADDGKVLTAQSSVAASSGSSPIVPVLVILAVLALIVALVNRRNRRREEELAAATETGANPNG